jgi:uncharacterized protein YpbB
MRCCEVIQYYFGVVPNQKLPVFSMNLFKLKRNKLTTSRAEPVLNGLSK